MSFNTVYNIINCIALIVLFFGIIYEKRIQDEITGGQYGWSGSTESMDGQFSELDNDGDSPVNTPSGNSQNYDYESDNNLAQSPLQHLDFASSDMISLVDD